jgi:hypothetical protein
VSTVMLHIYTNATDFGYLYAWPTGTAQPTSSTLASSPGNTSDNVAMTQVGTGGQISFLSMSTNPTDLTVDVEGYVTDNTHATAGATYVPLTQTRVVSSPTGLGRSTPLTSAEPNGYWNFTILGKGGLPTTGVAAVVMNLAAGDNSTTSPAQLDVGTGGADPSFASWKTFTYPGFAADQLAVVAPDSLGRIALSTNGTSVNVWIDVQGYYLSASAGGGGDAYVPVAPTRIVKTAIGLGIPNTLAAAGTTSVPITGVAGVPTTGVGAVALSLTTEGATAPGYDVMWADGVGRPGTSTVVAIPGMPNSNLAYVRPGTDGKMAVYSSTSNDLIADVEGYFQIPTVPGIPQNVSVSPDGGTGPVTWTAPTTDGGAAITSYSVEAVSEDSALQYSVTGLAPGTTSYSFTALDPSQYWDYFVTALNSVGSGSAGESDTAGEKPGADADDTAPAFTGTDNSLTSTTSPQTVSGQLLSPDGAAVAGAQVTLYPADAVNNANDGDTVTASPLAVVTTDASGNWSYTSPTYSGLPPSVQAYATADGGYLNVEATSAASTTVGGTKYPLLADDYAPAWVGTSGQATAPNYAVPTTMVDTFTPAHAASTPTLSQIDSSVASENNPDPEATWNDPGLPVTQEGSDASVPPENSYGLQSLSGADISPEVADDGTNLSLATAIPVNVPNAPGCFQTDHIIKNYHAYTVVGEYHAYWNATGFATYLDGASTDIGIAVDQGVAGFEIKGTADYTHTSSIEFHSNARGPYSARQLLISMKYQKYYPETICEGISISHGNTRIKETGLYNPGNGWTVFEYGKDVSQYDGDSASYKAAKGKGWPSKVDAATGFDLTNSNGHTYGGGASVAGISITSTTDRTSESKQDYDALGSHKKKHLVWGSDGVAGGNASGIVYSY